MRARERKAYSCGRSVTEILNHTEIISDFTPSEFTTLIGRQILWLGVTAHPTAEWISHQLTEAYGWSHFAYAMSWRLSSSARASLISDGHMGAASATDRSDDTQHSQPCAKSVPRYPALPDITPRTLKLPDRGTVCRSAFFVDIKVLKVHFC